jgi:hypothetical protein
MGCPLSCQSDPQVQYLRVELSFYLGVRLRTAVDGRVKKNSADVKTFHVSNPLFAFSTEHYCVELMYVDINNNIRVLTDSLPRDVETIVCLMSPSYRHYSLVFCV